ncbi:manganese transporter [Bacillus coahuilensis p1.1.43]|uniref:Manganese transporter n=1 Tax=Bacillus coahuilensis p1.1.43 TaxID=1150625 RepID=A0A147K8U2_9BACI|nr:zinc ABC transporter substrate-binding protein [Bacillus coahuilensis]KUP06626.1 manganese transporter [Bacillus coahuilensis p1.1.43]
MKHLRKLFLMMMMLVGMIVVAACGSDEITTDNGEEKIVVVTTIAQIADGVKNIGGDQVEVVSLMGPGVDPHLYKATQSDMKKLEQADMIFYNGLHLEGKMLEIFEKMNETKPTYAIAEGIDPSLLRDDMADATIIDPHIWFNIDIWQDALHEITVGLSEYDSENKELYEENEKKYFAELTELKEYAASKIQEVPEESRVLVTAHDAFNYFGAAYNMEVMGLQGLSTDAEYGLGDVQELVNVLVEREIGAVFVESSISEKSINAVIEGSKDKGHDVVIGGELFSDAMGEEGTEEGTYIGMYRHNVDTIVEALK